MSQIKTCKEFCARLSDYLDGEIGQHECFMIEEHLKICPPCAQAFESLRATVQICSQGVSDEIPDEVRQRLKTYLRKHCKGDECFS
jgi:anti-sigma factor RsiW